ncbi:hypothetical protein SAMN05443573_11817 [Celeribacter indicus]|nr:hypothetical protein SAMN05443573_11817 [Celeribacter indicus]
MRASDGRRAASANHEQTEYLGKVEKALFMG